MKFKILTSKVACVLGVFVLGRARLLLSSLHFHYLKSLVFKRELRPKRYPCFYIIFLLILWRKSLVQKFVTCWSRFTKLKSNKVLNSRKIMSYPRLYKTFHLCFSLLFVASFMKKNPIKFYGVLAHFSRTYEVVKF